jgi:membrane protease YdiL (CAAX protease family)
MNALHTSIAKHPLMAFFVITCAFSWALWGLMMASAYGWLPINFPTTWYGSFGPFVGAVAVAAILGGRTGVRDLLRPIFQWRFGSGWYLFVLFGCLLPFAVAFAVFVLLGGVIPAPLQSPESIWVQLPFFFVVVFLLGGPLGEEIGWRGFALPNLLKQHSPLMATFVVMLMWLVWHVPLWWLPGSSPAGTSIVSFIVLMAGFSLLFTWVYQGTAGSLFSVLLMHTSINTVSVMMSGLAPGLEGDPLFVLYTGIAALVISGIVIVLNRGMVQEPMLSMRPPTVRTA